MIIAISGLAGSGNTTASALVAKKLTATQINYTMRNLAQEQGMPFDDFHKKAHAEHPKWDLLLDAKQIEQAEAAEHAVLASRLAVLLVHADARIWLHAPLEVRAARRAKMENKPFEEMLEKTRERDEKDVERYRKLYGVDLRHPENFVDVIVNNERMTAEQTASVIASVWEQEPFKKNERVEKEIDRVREIVRKGTQKK